MTEETKPKPKKPTERYSVDYVEPKRVWGGSKQTPSSGGSSSGNSDAYRTAIFAATGVYLS